MNYILRGEKRVKILFIGWGFYYFEMEAKERMNLVIRGVKSIERVNFRELFKCLYFIFCVFGNWSRVYFVDLSEF